MENVDAEVPSPLPMEVLAPPINLPAEMNQIFKTEAPSSRKALVEDVNTAKALAMSFRRFRIYFKSFLGL